MRAKSRLYVMRQSFRDVENAAKDCPKSPIIMVVAKD